MKRRIWVCLLVAGFLWMSGEALSVAAQGSVRNVIWVIGDGMGPELMGFFMQGAREGALKDYTHHTSALEELLNKGTQGFFFTNTYNTPVTDSAAAATQMATGHYSLPERIGVDFEGNAHPTFLETAQQYGKSIGIISDAYVTDATPAGFTAHVPSRRQKMQIARQQLDLGIDVILGGGKKYFSTGENKELLAQAHKQGYQVVQDKNALLSLKGGKILGLFAEQSLPMAVEMHEHPKVPQLAQLTQKALEVLEKNPDGFVLIIEAGKIDWAAHANDAGATLAELKVLDKTLSIVLAYAQAHPDTLVYVNADHDTGLGSFSYQVLNPSRAARKSAEGEVLYDGNTSYGSFNTYALLEKQRRSLYYVERELQKLPEQKRTAAIMQKRLRQALGYPVDITEFENIKDVPGIFKQLNEKYGISWGTPTHSAAPLIGVAYGPYQELFGGVYHNTDILMKFKTALGWKEE
ncbi:MAG: alkaline phosphatase [Elusimicrobiaceae bacterium]|nr:alkaline phosphatase [Elusimicrobiaceae bacterium]